MEELVSEQTPTKRVNGRSASTTDKPKATPRKGSKRTPETAPAKRYEPTPTEQAALAAIEAKEAGSRPAPGVSLSWAGMYAQIGIEHECERIGSALFANSLGSVNDNFINGFIKQVIATCRVNGEVDDGDVNFMLSVVQGIEPRDQIEAMLALQMAAIQNATLKMSGQLANAQNIHQQDSAERGLNKLARTFTTQVEALKRYRSKGEQTMRVEHVTVNEGGQAIVGAVNHAPAGAKGDHSNDEV